MKKFYTATAVIAMACAAANAQSYITPAPEGGFDASTGKDYVVLYAPQSLMDAMGSKVISNQNLDETQTRNYLEYWTCDWDKTLLTLYNVPEEGGKNSFGDEEYINATPLWAWGTGVFMATGTPYDLSAVTDNHHIHIGLRDFGSSPSKYQFGVGPTNNIKTNGFQVEVGIPVGDGDGDFVGVGSLPNGNDGKWYYLDLPISELIDPNGNFGFSYNFSQPFAAKTGAFSFTFKDPVCSSETHTQPGPGETVCSYTITKLGSALSIDHVIFYVPDGAGVENVAVDNAAGAPVYFDLFGRKVENPGSGLYIVKTAEGFRKVIL